MVYAATTATHMIGRPIDLKDPQVSWEPSSAMLSYLSMVRPHVAAPKSVSARLSSNSSREVMAMVSCRVRSAKQDRQHWQEHITTVTVTV